MKSKTRLLLITSKKVAGCPFCGETPTMKAWNTRKGKTQDVLEGQ